MDPRYTFINDSELTIRSVARVLFRCTAEGVTYGGKYPGGFGIIAENNEEVRKSEPDTTVRAERFGDFLAELSTFEVGSVQSSASMNLPTENGSVGFSLGFVPISETSFRMTGSMGEQEIDSGIEFYAMIELMTTLFEQEEFSYGALQGEHEPLLDDDPSRMDPPWRLPPSGTPRRSPTGSVAKTSWTLRAPKHGSSIPAGSSLSRVHSHVAL